MAAYPGYNIEQLTSPAMAIARGGHGDARRRQQERRFNPFTGKDMGAQRPLSVSLVEWTVDLHDNLLLGMETGRRMNALGASWSRPSASPDW